ncbi:MAG: hypothetical protein O8C61_01635 [Candidatus Methanoperedens sp.]|nr:hypothetical protein [Candidatus Methanoperedens sp.]
MKGEINVSPLMKSHPFFCQCLSMTIIPYMSVYKKVILKIKPNVGEALNKVGKELRE